MDFRNIVVFSSHSINMNFYYHKFPDVNISVIYKFIIEKYVLYFITEFLDCLNFEIAIKILIIEVLGFVYHIFFNKIFECHI